MLHGIEHIGYLKGNRFQRGAGNVRFAGATSEAAEAGAGIGLPVGRPQAGKGGHQHHALAAVHLLCQRLDFMAVAYKVKVVAQPLHNGAGHKHAAFQRVLGGLAALLPRHGAEQLVLAVDDFAAGIHQHKAAGAIGVFGHARMHTAMAEQRRLLVADGGKQRQLCAQ